MGVSKELNRLTIKLNEFLRRRLVSYSEHKNIKKKRALIDKVFLTKEEEKQIFDFFQKHYGKTIKTSWHRLYQSYTGKFHKDYFPEILFSTKLEPMLNPYYEAEFLDDKNWLPVLFSGIEGLHIPHTYGACVRGNCYIGEKNVVSQQVLIESLKNVGKCVIKKTIDTSSGRDVRVCDISDGKDIVSNERLEHIVKNFGKDFIVQEFVTQSVRLANLNDTSINTFRVISYICDGAIYVCPIALRLGRNNATKDNIHYGGICVGVKPNGTLREAAYSEYGDMFLEHPDSHIVFLDYCVLSESTKKLEEMAKKLHSRILHLGILSWDFALDNEENVVLIEMNCYGQSAWFCQMVNGEPLFGENTEKILKMIKKR